ncbi:MAG: YqaA family protein [Pseudomonadota bacterium]
MLDLAAYAVMFGSAFLAATVFPAQSELVLIGFLTAGQHSVAGMLIVASIGNVLGSVVNYYLGLGIQHYRDKPWFPGNEKALARGRKFYAKWGRWSLLLAWTPVIGDPLTVVAGVMREKLWVFLVLVTISKVTRYVSLAAITLGIIG